jgi:hypothetical protein
MKADSRRNARDSHKHNNTSAGDFTSVQSKKKRVYRGTLTTEGVDADAYALPSLSDTPAWLPLPPAQSFHFHSSSVQVCVCVRVCVCVCVCV